MIADPQTLRLPRERRGRHEGRLGLRLLALVVFRELAKQQVRNHEPEHGIAEKLQRLVVEHAAAGILVGA